MKKIIMICALLIGGSTMFLTSINASQVLYAASDNSNDNDMPADARQIDVYICVGANDAVVPKKAHYSPSKNRIYIQEGRYLMNYNVYSNPQYGQDSAKGRFKYYAGDYYFDL